VSFSVVLLIVVIVVAIASVTPFAARILAAEIRGIVGAAAALVEGDLRMRTERTPAA
jgi:hypothetical protein